MCTHSIQSGYGHSDYGGTTTVTSEQEIYTPCQTATWEKSTGGAINPNLQNSLRSISVRSSLLEGPAGTDRPKSVFMRLRVLVQISSKWLPCSLLMLLVGHHNFEISCCHRYIGPGTCPTEPKLFFPIFWNGQIHVHFELARCEFGDYIIITDMMKNPMQ